MQKKKVIKQVFPPKKSQPSREAGKGAKTKGITGVQKPRKKSPSVESLRRLYKGGNIWATYWRAGMNVPNRNGFVQTQYTVESRWEKTGAKLIRSPKIMCFSVHLESFSCFDWWTRSSSSLGGGLSSGTQLRCHLLWNFSGLPYLARCSFSLFLFTSSSPH